MGLFDAFGFGYDPAIMQALAQNPEAAGAALDAARLPPPQMQMTPGSATSLAGAFLGPGGESFGDLLPQPGFGAAMPGMPGMAGAPGASPLAQYGMQTAGGAPGIGPWQTTVNPAAAAAGGNPQAAALANVARQVAAPAKTEYPRLIPQNAPQQAKVPDRMILDILMAGLGGRGGLPGGGR